ncbi:ABC transporter substrate-binding protein [Nakamurella endophytica]|uniref:Sugar ABC transporter substrate-binding protein n=1 Tax=Nakamurella endophytica TaxID=1748367 RepID=A0A917SRD2_9ACTN|nr:sugar ABC transporter substrate-binding protein [Nakamurella endophytica]GGL93731.1 sugar ABC transporter substrate-binding protein [Nakamurella endophytica]
MDLHPVSGTGSPVSRRRFFGVAGLVAAAGVATACGSNTGRDGGSSSSAAGPATSTAGGTSGSAGSAGSAGSGAASGTAPAGSVSLSQWYHAYGEEGTQQAVERYAAGYTKAKVTVQWNPGDYDKKVAAALLTGSGPDVFETGNGPSIDQIQSGQVAPLDGILGSAQSDFTASLVERMSYKGKLYAVPQVIDMQLLVYRKSMLDKAGVKPPTTFDELVAAAKALTTSDVKGLFLGNDGGAGVMVGPVLWSVGADYLTKDNAVGFDDPNVATAFGRLHELFASGSLLLGAPTDWSDPSSLTQGLTAMQWTGLWTFPVLAKELGDDFGVLPWPKFSATVGSPSVPIGAYGSTVSAKSKDVQAAKDYVRWLWVENTADQLDFAQSYGFHVPARKSLADKADKLKSGPAADAVDILQKYGHAQTPLLWTPASGTAMSDAVTNIVKSGADPKAALAGVRTTVQAELARVAK